MVDGFITGAVVAGVIAAVAGVIAAVASVIVAVVIINVVIIVTMAELVFVTTVAFYHYYKEELIIFQNLTLMVDSDRWLDVSAGNFSKHGCSFVISRSCINKKI
jgi:hypothetical protein